MATADQQPGSLNISFRRGDEFGTLVDFSISTTGYTWTSDIYSLVTGATVASPSVSVVDASAGQVNVSLTELQTASLAAGTYGFRVTWIAPGPVTRTVLDGKAEVLA